MSDPQNPNDPFHQQSANQPWGQESASQPESQQWGGGQGQQPWGGEQPQQSWGEQSQHSADQWGAQYGQAPGQPVDPNAGQWGQQQDPYAAQYGQQGGWAGGPAQQPGVMPTDGKSFFSALFDFNFTSFVTPKIIKVVYIVVTAAIGLGVLFFIISALLSGEPLLIIGSLILGPIMGIIYLALARMSLELYYAVIRLSEDVHERLPRQ